MSRDLAEAAKRQAVEIRDLQGAVQAAEVAAAVARHAQEDAEARLRALQTDHELHADEHAALKTALEEARADLAASEREATRLGGALERTRREAADADAPGLRAALEDAVRREKGLEATLARLQAAGRSAAEQREHDAGTIRMWEERAAALETKAAVLSDALAAEEARRAEAGADHLAASGQPGGDDTAALLVTELRLERRASAEVQEFAVALEVRRVFSCSRAGLLLSTHLPACPPACLPWPRC